MPMGPTSKGSSKVAKSTSNCSVKHGSRTISLGIPTKGARPDSILFVQGIAVQSQALLNVKDSNENDMMRFFREDLHKRLQSTDFNKQVDGVLCGLCCGLLYY
ncbi:protein MOR1-like [Mangifera indica]|uniref:protein MOR1-like n=1 Tax=Mangifera indica TaxID=29780 RepID=UPI001CF9C577|nr:protein MOR1-like [Mangifera indica]